MRVFVAGRRLAVDPARLLGSGGEADVFDLGDGRALKLWKGPDHPDVAGVPAAQAAAAERLQIAPRKLARLPRPLAGRVVAPLELASADAQGTQIVGFTMPVVAPAESLHGLGERPRRDAVGGAAATALLRDLRRSLAALHDQGVVVGDLNDLNVLVQPAAGAAHLIDVDSFQLPGYPCKVFTERFVDPRLCQLASGIDQVRPHDPASDWYAFAAMVMGTLLGVGPFGGVPRRPAPAWARLRDRLTVFDADVRYPRPALPLRALPDELLAFLAQVFVEDRRDPLPDALLARLCWRRCSGCGGEHARPACPVCAAPATAVRRPTAELRVLPVPFAEAEAWLAEVAPVRAWAQGSELWREGAAGPEIVGQVLAGRTRVFPGRRLGVAIQVAGRLSSAALFHATRRGLLDGIALPELAGGLVSAHAALGDEVAWLGVVTRAGARLVRTLVAIGADGAVLGRATADAGDAAAPAWLAGTAGAAAAARFLLVPTDDGVVRVEPDAAGGLTVTRTFAATAPYVDAATRLSVTRPGLLARRGDTTNLLVLGDKP